MARPAVTLKDAVTEYLSLRTDLKGSTLREYESTLRVLTRKVGPSLRVRSLTPRHFEEFFMTGKTARIKMLAPSSYNKEVTTVGTFLNFCQGRGYVGPHLLLNVRRQKVPQKKRLRLSPHELLFMLEYQQHPRDRMIVALGLNTALRASEIASLKISDVDLDAGWLYTTLHKNDKVDMFPISADLDTELRRWLTWYGSKHGPLQPEWLLVPAKVGVLPAPGGRIAADHDCDVQPTRSALRYMHHCVHRALRDLGHPTKQEGLHTLRRSVARAYYDKLTTDGETDALRVTQQLLNHSSAITTEHYLGVERERTRRDDSLRGKPFLSALVEKENVVSLRKVEDVSSGYQGQAV